MESGRAWKPVWSGARNLAQWAKEKAARNEAAIKNGPTRLPGWCGYANCAVSSWWVKGRSFKTVRKVRARLLIFWRVIFTVA